MSEPAISRGRGALSPIHARAQMHRAAAGRLPPTATTNWHGIQKRVYARAPFFGWGFGGWGLGVWPYGPYFDDAGLGPYPMQDSGFWPAPEFFQPPPCVVPLVIELRRRGETDTKETHRATHTLPAVIYGSPASCPPPVLAAAHVIQVQRE